MIEPLVKRGFDVNAQNKSGKTPLHMIARDFATDYALESTGDEARLSWAKYLIDNGAKPSLLLEDSEKNLPWQTASSVRFPKTKAYLQKEYLRYLASGKKNKPLLLEGSTGETSEPNGNTSQFYGFRHMRKAVQTGFSLSTDKLGSLARKVYGEARWL